MTFKMKKPPEEPVRKIKNIHKITIYDGDSLKKIIDSIPSELLNSACFGFEHFDYYDNHSEVFIKYEMPESDEEYNKRYNKYLIELKKYNEWYEENKETITNLVIKKKETVKKALNTQISNLEKQLEKLKKRVV
jgi:hypothetical protein